MLSCDDFHEFQEKVNVSKAERERERESSEQHNKSITKRNCIRSADSLISTLDETTYFSFPFITKVCCHYGNTVQTPQFKRFSQNIT